jgi:hypothetical protein
MLTQVPQEGPHRVLGNPVDHGDDTRELDETIKALLILVGLRAKWVINYWKVYLPDAQNITSNIGGRNRRWQTGVRAGADYEEWMAEINRFWKDVHPNEPMPFGGILPAK